MKNHIFLFFTAQFCVMGLSALPNCYFEHYSSENGLPQHTVMDILQNQKGFMWFSTWDGLCKFDGYDFTTYKIQHGDMYQMRSNRIDHIFEDVYGYIWTLSYDKEAHRFDPKSERFMSVKMLKEHENIPFIASDIIPVKSGRVWLLSEKNGCICIKDSTFNVELFNIENGKIQSNAIHSVYEDAFGNTWILTGNGLVLLKKDSSELDLYFSEHNGNHHTQAFYSAEETDNEIWFGSSDGRVWRYNKKSGQFSLLDLKSNAKIISIKKIDNDKILVVSDIKGFFIYDFLDATYKNYTTSNLPNLQSNELFSTYVDSNGDVWLESNAFGVSRFDPATEKMSHYTPKIESAISTVFLPNFFIFEDIENRLWVHPRGGGFSSYDRGKDILQAFYNEPGSPDWRFSNMLHNAFSDRQGNLWLSTRSHGLDKAVFDNNSFQTIIFEKEKHSTVNNDVRAIFEDSNQNIWVSTKGGKIYVYDEKYNNKGYLCNKGEIAHGQMLSGIAYAIMQDKKSNIWIGTKGQGVYKLTKSGNEKYDVKHYRTELNDVYSLSDNNIYSIYEDCKEQLWIGSYGGGLNLYDEANDRFINHRNHLKQYPIQTGSQIRIISSDAKGNVLIGTTIGLIVFSSDFKSPEDIDFKICQRSPGDNNSISANDIFDICTTHDGDTYIATFGGGVNKVIQYGEDGFPEKFKSYTTSQGLPSDVVLSLVEDKNGILWICTENNLTKFDDSKETFETFSEVRRLIKGNDFSEGSRYGSVSGDIMFGFSQGMIKFSPKLVKNNTYVPNMALVGFRLFNKSVPVGEGSPLTGNIDNIGKLTLKRDQNFFTLEFAALDYVDPDNILYAYKLEGFDKDWIYCQNQRAANYTNLSKGVYKFVVKSTNSDGVWVNNERSLEIEIKPSFWETPWAYLLYMLAFSGLIYVVLRVLFVYYRMKDRIELEHRQTEMKARFFTDISHEIRTPLTMIVSPIENLLQDTATPSNIKSQLELVSKNTSRMLKMVNQILDFRKIQQRELNLQETPIGKLVQEISSSFIKPAEDQHILFVVDNKIGNETIWIDQSCVEKIIVNLLSNAFKYTPEGKTIKVTVFNDRSGGVGIEVQDEGVGISREKQSRLFKRFESFNEDKNKPSTGIGLSMVKELADKHHAKVFVDSQPNAGSTFTVIFQRGLSHFDENINIISTPKETEEEQHIETENLQIQDDAQPPKEDKLTVLIVEDDDDLRKFICTILEKDYIVHEAADGEEGLKKAMNLMPDLIVSDIMMPKTDGIELLRKVRENINTSHILFLLLTAKTTLESKLEGLDKGADEYITKPFNVPYFRAKIKTMLERRSILQHYYRQVVSYKSISSTGSGFSPSKPEISSQDDTFMKTVIEIIEKNIDNSDFMIEDLTAEVGMSRTVFYKKIKSLTGLAPVEFIRDIVIQRAAQLLESGNYSVKEVAYIVGMSDAKYFSKCFKKKYDMTPSEYKKQFD